MYLFKDASGVPVYIGKALSIKKRVSSHFRAFGKGMRAGLMLDQVRRIDYVETPTEAEALLLEQALVKENLPKFNIELRDDKSYPFLKISASEKYPRLLIVRGRKSDGGKYFGPFTEVRLLKKAVDLLRELFPLRTCKTLPKKVCLMYHIGQCGGPCEGHQTQEAYVETVKELEQFLEGKRDALVRSLSRRMREYSANQEFEKAKAAYDMVRALSTLPVIKRSSDKSPLLEALKNTLELPVTPVRMECFDVSNISGQEAVASMVTFENGKPLKSHYRRFRIKTVSGIDDYQMMREAVRRRYSGSLSLKMKLPDLLVIDGGKGHLAAAKSELDTLGLQNLPIISIAKQHEHLFKPERPNAYVLPQSSPALQILRHLRDEAHRFAISYHRNLRSKRALK